MKSLLLGPNIKSTGICGPLCYTRLINEKYLKIDITVHMVSLFFNAVPYF